MDGSKNRKKEKNPRENANILSVITFFYTLPTFIRGYKNDFEEDDLYETYSGQKSNILGNQIEKLWIKEMERAKNSNKRPSLGKVLFQCFSFDHMLVGFIFLFNEIVVKTLQVLALGELVSFYMTRSEHSNINDAYFYAGKIISFSLLVVLISQPVSMSAYHIGIKMRVACCSLIYRKALRLNRLAFEKTTTGQMVNLISNDVKNIDVFCQLLHYVWIGPIQTIFLSYFMYKEAGYSSIFGVLFLVVFIPLHFYMGIIQSVYRTKSASRTDERLRLMNEIIHGIPVIKMYTWEKPFAKLIALYRKLEMKAIRITAHIKGIYSAGVILNAKIAVFLSILSYVLINNKINAQQVFVLTGFYNILRQTMIKIFPIAVSLIAETNVCFKRMIDFLLLEEVHQVRHEYVEDNGITIKDFSAKWSSKLDYTLSNLNLSIKPGCLTAIIGLVGSGKSSLLNAILKEMPITEGDLFVKCELSYSSQEPWLFQETVQQNILFGSSLDLQHYKKVVKACALQNDFRQLPQSDSTIVGDRGTSLSGGQKARVNLARAVYKEADVYLLDDPLSAVDTHVGKEIFDKCIKTFLKGKTVVLVTHQLQYLKDSDYIVVLDNGSIIAHGCPLELQESGVDFARFLRQGSTDVDDKYDEKHKSENLGSKTSLNEKKVEAPVIAREQKVTGSVSDSIYKEYIKAGANCLGFGGLLFVFLIQVIISGSDYFLAYWVNIDQDQEHNLESDRLRLIFLIGYSCLILLLIFISAIQSVVFVETCVRTSVSLHNNMFKNIIKATLRFFYMNPSGRILNRFSKDMGAIDELLPSSIIETLTTTLMVVGIVAVISVVNAWLILPVLIIAVVFYFLRKLYIGTGRSIKRLDGVTKSPVISHLNASLQGLGTIRAAKAQSLLVKEFDNHQDLNTCASYLFMATSKAFGYCLDLCCIVYITVVTLSSIFSPSENYGGNVGLIISQALMLTGVFQWAMRQIAETENHMTSVERVLEYNDIETEELYTKTQDVAKDWPKKAQIEFENVSLRYFRDSDPVLKKVTFKVEALQNIGIVGRTGAGKSSLINALFLMADVDGTILIDSVDTKNVSLHQLRSSISIIPQEPILFSGSMRKNLDPFDEFADKYIWEALEKVELKDAVINLISGLDAEISEGGSNLSVGQRQLVCLARALLRNNKILVLDEATANVDHVTDALIQDTIRKQFTQCTVLTIAHRLDTVIDCDKILVMDAGQVVEFDQPRVLLENTESVFYGMVQETGKVIPGR